MTKPQERELIVITTVPNIKGSGLMTSNTDMEFKYGSTAVIMKGITIWGRKVEKENTHGKMEAIMMEIG